MKDYLITPGGYASEKDEIRVQEESSTQLARVFIAFKTYHAALDEPRTGSTFLTTEATRELRDALNDILGDG